MWRAFILILGFLSLNARSEPISIGGRLFADEYGYTGSGQLAQSSLSAWLEFDEKAEKGLGAHLVLEGNGFAKDIERPDRASATGQVREAYVSYLAKGFDLRLGEQIIPWGKSDGVNPTDYFTAKNYTFLNPDDEVRRIGAPAVNLSFTPDNGQSPFTFQAIFQARYPQTKLLIPSQVIPAGLQVNLYPTAPAVFSPEALEGGMKISYTGSSFDLSLSVFKGVSAIPEFVFDGTTGVVNSVNFKENAFGTDGSWSFGDFVLRFESAVLLPENGGRNDPLSGLVEPNHWDSVIGIERSLFTDFRAQVQFLYRYHLNFNGSPTFQSPSPIMNQIQSGIARANATLLNYQRQANPGATFRLSYAKDASRWTADLFFVGYFVGGSDFLLRPEVGYSPFENFKILAGMDYYGGNASRPLGALNSLSDAFFEAKFLF